MSEILVENFATELAKMGAAIAAGPYNRPLEEIASGPLRDQVADSFASQKSADGQPWEPWHWRKKDSSDSHPTLDDSSTLKSSYLGQGAGHVEEIGTHDLAWGSQIRYARVHEHGATITTQFGMVARGGRGWLPAGSELKIPARPLGGWNDKTLDACGELIADAGLAAIG